MPLYNTSGVEAVTPDHNDLGGLQGGDLANRIHLTPDELSLLTTPPHNGEIEIDFGDITEGGNDGLTSVSVTGLTWVTGDTHVQVVVGSNSADHSLEDAALERLQLRAGDIVEGDSFTIYATAPEGTYGKYNVFWQEI